ncbi:MAG TPA: TIGR03862 family flavoprotein [Alphaproteobacteria bacterium]|nr:TIGR03862 family flavoprotein [Alphaproteobacteria bacterium]
MPSSAKVAIIGGGPSGLMAAETLAADGTAVHVFDAMPSVGRKFLMAGKSGLNLTHAEPFDAFLGRFGHHGGVLAPHLARFGPDDLRDWARGLGVETFVGSSGRVFPVDFKAAPLLREWLRRLRAAGVRFHLRHRWRGWADDGALRFDTPDGDARVDADALVLAVGGASWPRLGSDGAWVPLLRGRGVEVAPLRPANCGFDVDWTDHFRDRFAGQPVKPVVLTADGRSHRGEFVVTREGVEGSAVYAHAAALRDRIDGDGEAVLILDLAPDRDRERLAFDLAKPRGSRSVAGHLRRAAGLEGGKAGLLRECLPAESFADPRRLAAGIKALPLRLRAARPIGEAISSAGGVPLGTLDAGLMIRALPGVFCAGEMLDWEAPTGGYLLTACFALGHAAGSGCAAWLRAGADGASR